MEEKKFTIKQYPLKGINTKELNEMKNPICTCGHFKHFHKTDKTIVDDEECNCGECYNCLCPKYEYYTDMTFGEYYELCKFRKGDIST